MKIAIFHNILWSKYKGGVFSELEALCKAQGIDTEFVQIAETEGERALLSGVNLAYHRYQYSLLFQGAYSKVPRWRRVLALTKGTFQNKADLVIMPGYDRIEFWAMLAVLVLRGKRRAVFCDSTAYDQPPSKLKGLAKRLFFSQCHGFFGYGQRSKEYLLTLGAAESTIFFRCQAAALPLGYTEAHARANRLSAHQARQAGPLFIYVGRLSAEKGLFTMLDAMALLVRQQPEARLRVIGAGPLQSALAERLTELSLQDHVVLAGSMDVDQLAEQYAQTDAVLLPSTSEPWGLVVNEALSHGCPAIVSHHCGCVPELVVDGVTGYSFPTGNAAALAARMNELATSFTDVQAVTDRCIAHMRRYTPERAAEQILAGCRTMLAAAGSAA